MIWLLVTLASLALGFWFWVSYRRPVNVLTRQAEILGWVPVRTEVSQTGGFDTLHARGHYLVRLQQNGALVIVTPAVQAPPFKSFFEVERWITEHERREPPDNY